ncbi:2-amino-4-hydroxy-6-hydroxymethyldihydropteridine diphosphokinase [Acidobacteriota bacterium]
MKYFLSLGSNLGDKGKNLSLALTLLEKKGVKIIRISSIYKTQPVDSPSHPWFLNQVIEIIAQTDPISLLKLLKSIENQMGRKHLQTKAPRIIDLDILLAGRTIIHSKELEIPHPRLQKRNFVLVPLMEISPNTVHPILKKTIKNLWQKSKDCSEVARLKLQ